MSEKKKGLQFLSSVVNTLLCQELKPGPSNVSTLAMTFFYIIFCFLSPAFFKSILILSSIFAIGVGLYFFLAPQIWRRFVYSFVLMPFIGSMTLVIAGSIFIGFSLPIRFYPIAILFYTVLSLLLAYIYRRAEVVGWSYKMWKYRGNVSCLFLVAVLPLILILIWPVLFSDVSTSPYRFGPDLASYSKMAQYLIDVGTWSSRKIHAGDYLEIRSTIEISHYADATMSWPFLYWFRWGESASKVFFYYLTLSSSIYEVAFISLLPNFLLIGGLTFLFLNGLFKVSRAFSALAGFLILFNTNLINLWYEGFYGQIFAIPYLFFVSILCFQIREICNADIHALSYRFLTREYIRLPVIGVTSIFAILVTYGEGLFFVLSIFYLMVIVLDLALGRGLQWKSIFALTAVCAIALIMVLPLGYFREWLDISIRSITEAGGNGFPQPRWAMPSEIFGFIDIYKNIDLIGPGKLVPRGRFNLYFNLFTSVAITLIVIAYATMDSRRNSDKPFFLAGFVLTAFFYFFYPYKTNNNYGYMKIYTTILPLLFVFLCVAIYQALIANRWNWGMGCRRGSLMLVAFFLLIPMNGFMYVRKYIKSCSLIPRTQMELKSIAGPINSHNGIILPTSDLFSGIGLYMLGASAATRWINPAAWDNKSYPASQLVDKNVFLLTSAKKSHIYSDRYERVFINKDYVLFNTGKSVGDGLVFNLGSLPKVFNSALYY